ncbi:unnamed protein product [Boreogadus saida]
MSSFSITLWSAVQGEVKPTPFLLPVLPSRILSLLLSLPFVLALSPPLFFLLSLSLQLSLSLCLSVPLSPVSLNQDIACPFLFIAASLGPSLMLLSPICFSFRSLSPSLPLSLPL